MAASLRNRSRSVHKRRRAYEPLAFLPGLKAGPPKRLTVTSCSIDDSFSLAYD
jgi:hypothetical protein